MPRTVKLPALTDTDAHDLWVLLFKLRWQCRDELDEMKSRDQVKGTLALMGLTMNELRSRGQVGQLF